MGICLFPTVLGVLGSLSGNVQPKQENKQQTVLLLDPDPTSRDLIAHCLDNKRGANVHAARNIRNAEVLQEELKGGIDLLITDHDSISGNGYRLLKEFLSQNPCGRALVIGGSTSGSDPFDIGSADCRRVETLEKPFSTPSLLVRIWDLLRANG